MKPHQKVLNLFTVSQNAMWLAISMIKDGAAVEDIVNTVEKYANKHCCSTLKLPIMAEHFLGKCHIDGWLVPLYTTNINKNRIL